MHKIYQADGLVTYFVKTYSLERKRALSLDLCGRGKNFLQTIMLNFHWEKMRHVEDSLTRKEKNLQLENSFRILDIVEHQKLVVNCGEKNELGIVPVKAIPQDGTCLQGYP